MSEINKQNALASSKMKKKIMKNASSALTCIKGESNPRRVDGNDPGYHYPINATLFDQVMQLRIKRAKYIGGNRGSTQTVIMAGLASSLS